MFKRRKYEVDSETKLARQIDGLKKDIEEVSRERDSWRLKFEDKERDLRSEQHKHALALEKLKSDHNIALRNADLEKQEALKEMSIEHAYLEAKLRSDLRIKAEEAYTDRKKFEETYRAELREKIDASNLKRIDAEARLEEQTELVKRLEAQVEKLQGMLEKAYENQAEIAKNATTVCVPDFHIGMGDAVE